jgi:hypothetical protein
MRVIRILPLVAMIACTYPVFASAADTAPAPEWDKVLDGIYSHTWRGRADLSDEVKKQESRIRQNLPDYIAAWERRMAAPAVSTGKESAGGDCGPLRYCAGDFLDTRGFITKLREKREPMARSLFEKLSPAGRKTVLDADLAAGAQPAQANQVLADELTRIVREDTFYGPGSLGGMNLSPATTALVQDPTSAMNRVCINKTIIAEAFPGELARNFKCVLQKDESYRRVVSAKTVQYLLTGDRKTLDGAIALSDTFANKLMYTDFAFWYYYPRALADIENGNSSALQSDAYEILNEVVLWEEPLEAGKTSPAEMERRHYAWNLADVVLSRGILDKKMGGLESLGPAVWVLGSRSKTQAISEREQELLRLIIDVRKYLSGPESDNYRLNYAVAMSVGKRRYAQLLLALDSKEKGESLEKLFKESRDSLGLAGEWAGTWQGKTAAVSSYLELVNTGLARMKNDLPEAVIASLAAAPDKENLGMAVSLYRGMAERETNGWEQLRFNDRKVYVDSAQGLWNALRRNSLLVGDYYLGRMDKDDFQSVMDNSVPAEKALLRYVNLFDTYAVNDGPREIIPDSAYFAYAEALKKLSRLERIIYSFNRNMELHNQSVGFLLKGIAVYPYDDSLSEYATLSRNINTGSLKTYPDTVVRSVVSNNVVAKCLQGNKSYCDANTRQALEWNIYKVRSKLYSSTNSNVLEEMKLLVQDWRANSHAVGKGKVKPDNQRLSILATSERYIALCEELTPQASNAMEQLRKCHADGLGCDSLDAVTDRLLSKRSELEKLKNQLVSATASWVQLQGGVPEEMGRGKDLEFVRNLSNMVIDEYVNQTDRLIEVSVQKKLYDLARMDNHPMHKIIKSGYYAPK